MAFYRFSQDDIINVKIATNPYSLVELNGDQVTGSVYLERPYLQAGLRDRLYLGFSEREGGLTTKDAPFTSSIDLLTAVSGGTNKELYRALTNYYNYYSIIDTQYAPTYNGSTATTVRVITVPEIYYDKEILSGTFSASDFDAAGAVRNIYDNGRGGLYSGSLTGTLVGHIFYPEGIAVLTKPDLSSSFGGISSENFKWRVSFKGTHGIPTQIYRCRAKAGELNASTNPTYYTTPLSGTLRGAKVILMTGSVYITQIGLYNEDYELVALANLAQPIKKEEQQDILFRLKMDF